MKITEKITGVVFWKIMVETNIEIQIDEIEL